MITPHRRLTRWSTLVEPMLRSSACANHRRRCGIDIALGGQLLEERHQSLSGLIQVHKSTIIPRRVEFANARADPRLAGRLSANKKRIKELADLGRVRNESD